MLVEAHFESTKTPEEQEYEANVRALTDEILRDPTKEKMYRDFMWQFVGDPATAEPGANQEPYPMTTWDNELHVYSTYVGGFFVHEADNTGHTVSKIVGIRSVEPLEGTGERAKDYMVVAYNLTSGEVEEPIVHRASKTGTERQPDWQWQLLDADAYRNWPPGRAPGLHAPPHAQNLLSLPATQPATMQYGQYSRYQLHDLDPLIERVNGALIERDGQLEVVHQIGATAVDAAMQ